MHADTLIDVWSEADVPLATARARRLLRDHGIATEESSRIATVVSELARNIARYAGRGQVAVRVRATRRALEIEVEAHDTGPGIADPDAALRNGFSTGGSLGLGLPGVRRLMDAFTLETAEGRGTRVVAVRRLPCRQR